MCAFPWCDICMVSSLTYLCSFHSRAFCWRGNETNSEVSWIYTEFLLSLVPASLVLIEALTMSDILFTYYCSSFLFNTIKYDTYWIFKISFVKASEQIKEQIAIAPLFSVLKSISIILFPAILFYTNHSIPFTTGIWGD